MQLGHQTSQAGMLIVCWSDPLQRNMSRVMCTLELVLFSSLGPPHFLFKAQMKTLRYILEDETKN